MSATICADISFQYKGSKFYLVKAHLSKSMLVCIIYRESQEKTVNLEIVDSG